MGQNLKPLQAIKIFYAPQFGAEREVLREFFFFTYLFIIFRKVSEAAKNSRWCVAFSKIYHLTIF